MSDNQYTCPSHEDMSAKIDEIHAALLGTLDRPGWVGRLATVERNLGLLLRTLGGMLAAAGLGLGAYVWSLLIHTKG